MKTKDVLILLLVLATFGLAAFFLTKRGSGVAPNPRASTGTQTPFGSFYNGIRGLTTSAPNVDTTPQLITATAGGAATLFKSIASFFSPSPSTPAPAAVPAWQGPTLAQAAGTNDWSNLNANYQPWAFYDVTGGGSGGAVLSNDVLDAWVL